MRRLSALKKLFKSNSRDGKDGRDGKDIGVAPEKTTSPPPKAEPPIQAEPKAEPKLEPKIETNEDRPPLHQEICPCDGLSSVPANVSQITQRQDSLPSYADQTGQHFDLWTQAYRDFETHQPELAADYSRHLMTFHHGNGDTSAANISDASARTFLSSLNSTEPLMEQLLANRAKDQWRIPLLEKDVKFREQVEKLAKFLLWSDQFVKTAVSAQPCAALAWSGVSILLPLINTGHIQHAAMLGGFEYITRVQMYWRIFETRETHESIHPDIFKSVTALYSCIVEYQARVICHLSNAQLTRTWEKMTDVNDWEGRKHKIEELDQHCSRLVSEVEQTRIGNIRDLQLREIHESRSILDHIRRGLKSLESQNQRRHDDQKETALLADLSVGYEAHKNIHPLRVQGTCEWLLKDDGFRKWRDNTTSNLLWVSAGPGCGKSVLARSLIDEEQLSTSATISKVCYFFFNRGNIDQVDSSTALSSMLHQLFIQDQTGDLMRLALPSHKNHGPNLKHNFSELWRILLACADLESSGEIICVFDALDECDDQNRDQLLQAMDSFFSSRPNRSRLKFLVTSRPYDDIEAAFQEFPPTIEYTRVDGDDKSHDIGQEINIVIDIKVQEFAKYFNEAHRRKLSDQLKAMENRTYLWLHLTFDIIRKRRSVFSKSSRMDDLLKSLPSQVSEAYEEILSHNQEDVETTRALLEILLAATRPLSLEEANYALTLAMSENQYGSHKMIEGDLWPSDSFKTVVRNLSGLFISVHGSKLSFIHLTAREFLIDSKQQREWHGRFRLDQSHATMASVCMQYLSVVDVGTLAMEEDVIAVRYPFTTYTNVNWATHYNSQHADRRNDLCDMALKLCDTSGGRGDRLETLFCPSDFKEYLRDNNKYPDCTNLNLASYLALEPVVRQILTNRCMNGDENMTDWGVALKVAAWKGHAEVVRLLLNNSPDTEEKFDQQNIAFGGAVLFGRVSAAEVLLDEVKELRIVGDEITMMALGMGGKPMVSLLLDRVGDQITLTDDLVQMVARNFNHGSEVMEVILEKRPNEVRIDEEVIESAAGNSRCAREVMKVLLDKRGHEITITESILKEAAENMDCGEAVLTLLLERLGDDVPITSKTFAHAAKNPISGKTVLGLLLDARSHIPVTDDVVNAAARNRKSGDEILALLVSKRQKEVNITEATILTAAANLGRGKEIMAFLLKLMGDDDVPISEQVIKGAAANDRCGKEVLSLLFNKWPGAGVYVTEEVLAAAASNTKYGEEVAALLLEMREAEKPLVVTPREDGADTLEVKEAILVV